MLTAPSRLPLGTERYFTFVAEERLIEYYDAGGRLRGRAEVDAVRELPGYPSGLVFELRRRLISCGSPIEATRRLDAPCAAHALPKKAISLPPRLSRLVMARDGS